MQLSEKSPSLLIVTPLKGLLVNPMRFLFFYLLVNEIRIPVLDAVDVRAVYARSAVHQFAVAAFYNSIYLSDASIVENRVIVRPT